MPTSGNAALHRIRRWAGNMPTNDCHPPSIRTFLRAVASSILTTVCDIIVPRRSQTGLLRSIAKVTSDWSQRMPWGIVVPVGKCVGPWCKSGDSLGFSLGVTVLSASCSFGMVTCMGQRGQLGGKNRTNKPIPGGRAPVWPGGRS